MLFLEMSTKYTDICWRARRRARVVLERKKMHWLPTISEALLRRAGHSSLSFHRPFACCLGCCASKKCLFAFSWRDSTLSGILYYLGFPAIPAWGSVWKEWYENGNMGTENSKKFGDIPRNFHQNLSKIQWKWSKFAKKIAEKYENVCRNFAKILRSERCKRM